MMIQLPLPARLSLGRRIIRYSPKSVSLPRKRKTVIAGSHRITVLPGDGIGPEITRVTTKLLERAGEEIGEQFIFEEAPFGGAGIDSKGKALPDETLALCKESDAVLLACIGGAKWDSLPAGERPERGLLAIRAALGTFANLRPAIVLPQLASASSLKEQFVSGVDLMTVRELNGGIYYGEPRGFRKNKDGKKEGFNTMVYSEFEVERVAHIAFDLAMKRGKRLCSVDKANVLEVSQLWKETVDRIGKQYPEVELEHMYIDSACMKLISYPKYFDVILTGNIFGDIISDAAGSLTGSLGMLPSACVGGEGPGIFEPVHGSAPDIAGKDIANPLAMVLSASMMCKYGLNLPQVGEMLDKAVIGALEKGYRTKDIASEGTQEVSCSQMGNLLLNEIKIPART